MMPDTTFPSLASAGAFGGSPFGLRIPDELGGADVIPALDAHFGAIGAPTPAEAVDRNRLEYAYGFGSRLFGDVVTGISALAPVFTGSAAANELAVLQAQAAEQQRALSFQQQQQLAAAQAAQTRNTLIGVGVTVGVGALFIGAMRSARGARRGNAARRRR